ncbi:MAG: hypothetical protein K2K69_01230, partial [Muribaculaceae bacterium]|nr:hypothetical protein [Muribaculaceae bacterium]
DKYGDDVAVVWVDVYPDITLPGDDYTGYHAMALTAIMGKGAPEIVGQLPTKVSPDRNLSRRTEGVRISIY